MSMDAITTPGFTLRYTLNKTARQEREMVVTPSLNEAELSARTSPEDFEGHKDAISCICWSPDGTLLASASIESICIWSASGQLLKSIIGLAATISLGIKPLTLHTMKPHRMNWSPDGAILSLTVECTTPTVRCSLGHENPFKSPFCDECGEPLDTNNRYHNILQVLLLIDVKNESISLVSEDSSARAPISLAWSFDGTKIVFCNGNILNFWTLPKKQLEDADKNVKPYKVKLNGQPVGDLACFESLEMIAQSRDHNWLALASSAAIRCSSCSALNRKGEAFCDSCGGFLSALPLLSSNFTVRCPVCNALSPKGEAFCSNRGCSLPSLPGDNLHENLFIVDTRTWHVTDELVGHNDRINDIVWAPDQSFLASGSDDCTIRIWRPGGQRQVLEGYHSNIRSLSISHDSALLASRSVDGAICLWDTQQWEIRAILEATPSDHCANIAFHPNIPILASLSENNTVIHLWELDIAKLVTSPPVVASTHYVNAKVVLVGDSGVGKTGLSLALMQQPFVPTESTHSRKVHTLDQQEVKPEVGQKEQRELLLWDLAGQSGYRVIHQLHLAEVSVALVIFDDRNETNPFAGVDHWVRALRAVHLAQERNAQALPMKIFLIAARVDRGGRNVSIKRLEKMRHEWHFDGYFKTSAKQGTGIAELSTAIKDAIDWQKLTRVTSSRLFEYIKEFLSSEKASGRLLATYDALYREFLSRYQHISTVSSIKDNSRQFDVCLKQVERKGLIRKLSFGNIILLRPELLDSYASSLANAIKDEPDGLGSIAEERILQCDFFIADDERIKDREQEKLLLIAMIEDLLSYEIALREDGEGGKQLVLPSQSMRENPDLPDPEGKAMIFRFEGPVANIYARLAVRLSHSGLFIKDELWCNAITFTTEQGGLYGLWLRKSDEGRGELVLFFDKRAGKETRYLFEYYIRRYLELYALPGTIWPDPIVVCPNCGTPLDEHHVLKRRQAGFDSILCSVCETRVFFVEKPSEESSEELISNMDRMADQQRTRDTTISRLEGKRAIDDFDVFLCHNDNDLEVVKAIGEQLKERGILPWLKEWEERPGLPRQRQLEAKIECIKSAAVFVGDGIAPWQQTEIEALLRIFVEDGRPVIPVLLANAPSRPKLPPWWCIFPFIAIHIW